MASKNVPRPGDVTISVGRIGPLREDEEVVVDVAMRERRRCRGHTGCGTMHVLQADGGAAGPRRAVDGGWGGSLGREVQHDVDGLIAEIRQEVGFPVVLVAQAVSARR